MTYGTTLIIMTTLVNIEKDHTYFSLITLHQIQTLKLVMCSMVSCNIFIGSLTLMIM